MRNKPLSAEQRQALEARYTWQRIVELRLNPVHGNFDTAHLKTINRRIFQDLPALGFADVTPGEFRPPLEPHHDWMKTRHLDTIGVRSHVAYSRMDKAAQACLESTLERANPAVLRTLTIAAFIHAIAALYAELDYLHPFSDGNSRTLREFTRQLAEASGWRLDWEHFATSAAGRDILYIARDRSVNTLALPHIQHASTRRAVMLTLDQFAANRDLPDLLRDAIRPLTSIP